MRVWVSSSITWTKRRNSNIKARRRKVSGKKTCKKSCSIEAKKRLKQDTTQPSNMLKDVLAEDQLFSEGVRQ